eukprot:Awhi_evm1s5470
MSSGAEPHTFQILPPAGLFRSNQQCIRHGERFLLSSSRSADVGLDTAYCGFHGCEVGRVENDDFVFGKGNFATLSNFGKVKARRTLNFKDHVIINSGFTSKGSPLGETNLYTDSVDNNVLLKTGAKQAGWRVIELRDCEKRHAERFTDLVLAKEACLLLDGDCTGIYNSNCDNDDFYLCMPGNDHPHTSFRLLPSPEEKYKEGCIQWNSKIVLKLNNLIVDEICDTYYGCRTAYLVSSVDEGYQIRFRNALVPGTFLLRAPPGKESLTGCIRSGDQ